MIKPTVSERAFEGVAASIHDARQFMSEIADLPDSVKLDDVVLVVSELTTNAVIHAHSPFVVRVEVAIDSVRVEISDENCERPTMSDGAQSSLRGHGLLIVDRLASEWGVVTTPAGKVVFAEFQTSAAQ